MDTERFSLLLLEPGEIYFEDFSAILIAPDTTPKNYESKKQIGRLKMCSKSLVFDPKDLAFPLVKIPLKDCLIIEKWKGNAKFLRSDDNVLNITSKQHIEMLEGNIIAPYKFCNSATYLFLLNYANISDCLPQICQLHRASTLPAAEQTDMIATIVHSRHARVSFDPLWLDLYEKIISEAQADRISPLVVNPGRVVLSTDRLYFQPYNNIETYPVLKISLSSIKKVVKRRFLLRHVGLEIYSNDHNTIPHIYLSFRTQSERDSFFSQLLNQPDLNLSEQEQDVMTLQWQNGILSNYDYLVYINSLADRTINDLTQYPVFPWVIADYTSNTLDLDDPNSYRDLSKPVGALNEERLIRLMERYEEMSHPKFIFGSHYSTPGFVLFYIVRLYPNYMLCLQNGRFDHPDRMFNAVCDVYKNCLNNMSDFKELIPEFYDTEQEGKFLINNLGINFGYRHDGTKVGNVELPPWAESPTDFVTKLREALESDYVSDNLHQWIDLIFGYKQRGDEAVKAKNLYYYLCYEGKVDLDSITDLNRRHALEVQIMEFGQIPKQVFKVPHPKRKTCLSPSTINTPLIDSPTTDSIQNDNNQDVWKNIDQLVVKTFFTTHKDAVSSLIITEDNSRIISVGYDSKLKVFSLQQNRQIRSANIGTMPLSSCIQLPDKNIMVVGSWDNNIIIYDLDFGREIDNILAHEDAVTCMAWGNKSQLLVSGSGDCTIRIWKGFLNNGTMRPTQSLIAQLDHNSLINCIAFNEDNTYLASGTEDGEIYVWDIENKNLLKKLFVHSGSVRDLSFSPDGQKLVSCSVDKTFQVIDLNTGMALYYKTLPSSLRCLKWDKNLLLLGADDGTLYIWDLIEVKLLYQISAHNGPIRALDIAPDRSFLISGGDDHQIKVWKPIEK